MKFLWSTCKWSFIEPNAKINSKWIKDLAIRPKTGNLLEVNIRTKALWHWIWYQFLRCDNQTQAAKEKKISTLASLKHFKIVIPKDSICLQNKKVTHRMREIFAKHIFDKGLISEIYRELLKLKNNSYYKTPFKNEQRIWIRISPEKIYEWLTSTWKDA